jgi:hypothetical protein
MVIKHVVITSILALQRLVLISEEYVALGMIFFVMKKSLRNKMVWSYEKPKGFVEWHFLGCFFKKIFGQCMRLNLIIFKHLCQIVTFAIDKNKYKHEGMYFNTNWTYNYTFKIEKSANILLPCDKIYKITIGITFIIIKECYVKIKIFLKLQIFEMRTLARMKTLVIW